MTEPADAHREGHRDGGIAAAEIPLADAGTGIADTVDAWADLFAALSDGNRLRILLAIHYRPGINVTDLAAAVRMTANATSHALALLRLRGVIEAERSGRERRWSIASDQIHSLLHQVGAAHSPLRPAP